MKFDSHMHTPLCGHAIGEPIEYVQAAAEKGIERITFTCHTPMGRPEVFRGEGVRMSESDFATYEEMVGDARRLGEDLGVEVCFGIEAEIFPVESYLEEMRTFLRKTPFDFVLGSLHHQLVGFQDWIEERGLGTDGEIIRAYFEILAAGAESGFYNSLAHPDLIRIYGTVEPFGPEAYEEEIKTFLDRVQQTGVCLEVNTSGFIKGVFEMHPDPLIVEWARAREIPLSIGSDAHQPAQVGQEFDRAYAVLRAKGYKHLTTFKKRQAEQVPIPVGGE
ncbi:MAG: histidinol-phosphatase [Puniceicoccaceae bacterium]